jgi:hypothetical protein
MRKLLVTLNALRLEQFDRGFDDESFDEHSAELSKAILKHNQPWQPQPA